MFGFLRSKRRRISPAKYASSPTRAENLAETVANLRVTVIEELNAYMAGDWVGNYSSMISLALLLRLLCDMPLTDYVLSKKDKLALFLALDDNQHRCHQKIIYKYFCGAWVPSCDESSKTGEAEHRLKVDEPHRRLLIALQGFLISHVDTKNSAWSFDQLAKELTTAFKNPEFVG